MTTLPHRAMRRGSRILAALLFPLAAAAGPWPEVHSDLPVDPALHAGTLPNGLRYLILPNAEPKNRVSLRLLVAVGSLQEGANELGLAHFVEHMAFRSTRTHPAGSLTTALQRLGVGLGPDVAAFTNYDHTIYHLELPDATDATLREGLRVFREYAQEVTFDPALIERERGVVLSEKATRDTPGARAGLSNLGFLFPNARQTNRPVIGTEATLRSFTRPLFTAFYDAWYRPERMAVIVVGTVEPAAVERMVAEELGKIAAHGKARPDISDLEVVVPGTPDVAVFSDPGLIGVEVTLEHPEFVRRTEDTHERRVHWLQESMAFAIFQERLTKISHNEETSFVAPRVALDWPLPNWRVANLSVSGRIDDWTRVLAEVEREHRRAIQFGFTADELARTRATFATALEENVRSAPTRPSATLATQLAASLVAGTTIATPAAIQADITGALAAVTLGDCLDAFRSAWTLRALHVFLGANPSFQIHRQQIADTLNKSRQTEVAPLKASAPVVFGYREFGPPGELIKNEHLEDLDVRLAEFANGVRLNFKSTSFEADIVDVNVRIGEGKLRQPKNQPGLDLLADAVLISGGLVKHTAQEIHDLFASHAVRYWFQVQSDACVFNARCARRELPLCLQLIAAYLTAPGFRAEAMREGRAQFGSIYSSLAASPGGPINLRAMRDMLGDRRWGTPLIEELSERNYQELLDWLEPQLAHGAIEMSVVGDVPWDDAARAVASTLGALPKRAPRPDLNAAGTVAFAPPPAAPVQLPIDAALKQSALAWYWPVPALKDIRVERRCHVLAAILSDRLRVRLREELGTAYSPTANYAYTDGFPDLNYFGLYAEVDPSRAAVAQQIIEREARSLATKGPTQDEFTRAIQPFLHLMSDTRQTNDYWGRTVLADAQLRPTRLEAARNRAADLQTISLPEIAQLAHDYLQPKAAFSFVTTPAGTPPPR